MYEESIRVPLIVYDPRLGSAGQGRRRKEMTLNIDLAPTMLDLAGVPRPTAMQGRSMRPIVEAEPGKWRRDWFYEHTATLGGKIPPSEGVRTDKWKYIRYPETTPVYEELYDLEHDKLEEHNLAREAKYSKILEQLKSRRQVWSDYLDKWSRNSSWKDPAPISL
jgi:arylsulfatase A-like enzyme